MTERRPPAPRIVLDTNVCLDLLLFRDPRTAALQAALDSGEVVAVTSEECRGEWLRVLRYPVLRLDEAHCDTMTVAFDALMLLLPHTAHATLHADAALPRCRDPDDQKFLQLAHASGARWLLSRDRHLLSLARRCRREGLFGIATPEAWAASDRFL